MSDERNIKDEILTIRFWEQVDKKQLDDALETLRKKLIKAFHSPCLLANEENTKKINKLFGVKE